MRSRVELAKALQIVTWRSRISFSSLWRLFGVAIGRSSCAVPEVREPCQRTWYILCPAPRTNFTISKILAIEELPSLLLRSRRSNCPGSSSFRHTRRGLERAMPGIGLLAGGPAGPPQDATRFHPGQCAVIKLDLAIDQDVVDALR